MVDVNKSALFMAMLLNVNVTLDTDYRQMRNHAKLVRYCDFLFRKQKHYKQVRIMTVWGLRLMKLCTLLRTGHPLTRRHTYRDHFVFIFGFQTPFSTMKNIILIFPTTKNENLFARRPSL